MADRFLGSLQDAGEKGSSCGKNGYPPRPAPAPALGLETPTSPSLPLAAGRNPLPALHPAFPDPTPFTSPRGTDTIR